MKKPASILLTSLLVISLLTNGLLAYYLYEETKHSSSIMKLGLSEHNIEIYCEKSEDIKTVKIDNKGSFFIGNAEIRNGEELFLVSPFGEINLSQTGSDAFVINSNGELIYQLAKPQSITSATVFATPSGERYHRDISCAGRAAFEVSQKTAELFGRTPCKLCIE